MSEPQIRVTAEDLVTHEVQAIEVSDDYVIVAAGRCEITHVNAFPTTGTHQITVKNAARGMKRDVSDGAGSFTRATVEALVLEVRRELRDDASEPRIAGARSYFQALTDLRAISEARRAELDLLILSCPGHEDDAGVRSWCAYCGEDPWEVDQ